MIVTWHEREAFGKALVVIISVLTVPGVLCQLHLKNKQTNKNPNRIKQTKKFTCISDSTLALSRLSHLWIRKYCVF